MRKIRNGLPYKKLTSKKKEGKKPNKFTRFPRSVNKILRQSNSNKIRKISYTVTRKPAVGPQGRRVRIQHSLRDQKSW